VVEPARDGFDIQNVVLVRKGGLGAATAPATSLAATAIVRSWTPSRRVLQVTAPTRSYLVVNENFNAGWRASLGGGGQSAGAGITLRPVRIDGWKQAWLLPAGTAGTVTLTYAPNKLYRDAIAGGLGTLALVMLVALWPAPGRVRARAWRPRWLALPKRPGAGRPRPGRSRPGWLRPGWLRAGRSREAGASPETGPPHEAGPAQEAASRREAGLLREAELSGEAASPQQAAPPEEATSLRETDPPREADPPPEADPPRVRGRLAGWPRLPGWLRVPGRLWPGWGTALTLAAAACGLLLAGLWLGGYPGAGILTAAAVLFTAAVSYRHRHRFWLELSRPWLVAALLLVAAACSVAGERLLAAGSSGPVVIALSSTAPQVICLAIVARLAAALFAREP
jgi:hypothetical protein